MIRHHPRPALLADYAKGSLPPGMALVISCHLEACAACNADASVWDSIGGALLGSIQPVALADDALTRTIARIGGARPRAAKELPAFLRRFSLPKSLRGQEIGFRRWLTPNIWVAPIQFPAHRGARTCLIYSRKNTALPQHTHTGEELTAVLHGAFRDADETFHAGDFARSDEMEFHSQKATAEGECLCLLSADGPMRFVGISARIVQLMAGTPY